MSDAVDFILVNGRIWVGGTDRPAAETLAAANGVIRTIGRSPGPIAEVGEGARVLDAGGRWVFPGFVDAHSHLIFGFQLGSWIDLSDRPSLGVVADRIHGFRAAHPDESIVVGYGFDYQALSARGLPDRDDLDSIEPDRAVLLNSWDGHTAWTNTRFVELVERYYRSLGREVGEPERDPRSGRLTGIFHRSFDLELPELKERRSLDGLRRMLLQAAQFGITTAFDVQVPLSDRFAYETLDRQGELPIRVRVALYHPKGTPPDRYSEFRSPREVSATGRLQYGAVKLYIDGVQETHTAAVLEPYTDDPANRGETVYSESELAAIVREMDHAGLQVLIHACGDRGVRLALDAYEALPNGSPTRPRRHRIEHCENVSPDDIDRFARLGVIPCMMPRHSSPDLTRRWRQTMGDERWAASFPWRELKDHGSPLAFASDWPVASLNPWVNLRQAVGRQDPGGNPSPHRLSLSEGVDAYTRGAAYATMCDADRGTLAVGKLCDLIILSEDPFALPSERLDEVHVLATVVGGQVVYSGLGNVEAGTGHRDDSSGPAPRGG